MGISSFEQRLERGVEGFFGRIFRSGLRPVELGRKLVRDMDDHRTVGVNGRTLVPNSFTFSLSGSDLDQLADLEAQLRRDLADAAREHARDEHYAFAGPVEVELVEGEKVRPGLFQPDVEVRRGGGRRGRRVDRAARRRPRAAGRVRRRRSAGSQTARSSWATPT